MTVVNVLLRCGAGRAQEDAARLRDLSGSLRARMAAAPCEDGSSLLDVLLEADGTEDVEGRVLSVERDGLLDAASVPSWDRGLADLEAMGGRSGLSYVAVP